MKALLSQEKAHREALRQKSGAASRQLSSYITTRNNFGRISVLNNSNTETLIKKKNISDLGNGCFSHLIKIAWNNWITREHPIYSLCGQYVTTLPQASHCEGCRDISHDSPRRQAGGGGGKENAHMNSSTIHCSILLARSSPESATEKLEKYHFSTYAEGISNGKGNIKSWREMFKEF